MSLHEATRRGEWHWFHYEPRSNSWRLTVGTWLFTVQLGGTGNHQQYKRVEWNDYTGEIRMTLEETYHGST